MKKSCLMLVISLIISLGSTQAQSNGGSIKPGEVWYDTDGQPINAHGGGVLKVGDFYYWFGEHRDSGKRRYSTWEGVRCYSSKDLINWTNEGIALAVKEDPQSEITAGCNIERPKVIYNERTKKYVMWFHLELKGQGYSAARTGVAISDAPTGPYEYLNSFRPNAGQWPQNFKNKWKKERDTDHLEWWTPEWREAVKEGLFVRRDFKKGQMARDMTLFVDDDGTAYHIHSAEENLTLHISELTDDYLDFTGKYVTVKPAGHNEAPAIFKHEDDYYMVTSGCTGWDPNAARSFKAKSVMGPWEPLGNPCKGPKAELTFDAQSTFILPVSSDKYIFMADRWNPRDLKDSRYVWLPLSIVDGKPVIQWQEVWAIDALMK